SEIDKTDKTNMQTNQTFLETIFGNHLNDTCPLIVAFDGNPINVQKNVWFGHPWNGNLHLDSGKNNYFSLAVFKPNDSGEYRRKKSQFYALYAIMLDDIGS